VTALPRIGIRLHGGLDPLRCVELAREAEAQGLDSAWFAENPFERGVLPAASASAAATRRLRIGLGVVNPFNRHPTLIAMEIGALDALSGGRAALGIGAGIGAAVERMGLGYDRPLAAVRDAILIVRGMLRGEEVSHAGRVFSTRGARLGYAPPRADMPILMAARGDQALGLCGRIADGLVVSNMCPPGFTAHAAALTRRAAREAGRPPPAEIVQYVPCAVHPEADEAYRTAKTALGAMLPSYWALGERFPAARAAMLRDTGIAPADAAAAVARLKAGEDAADALDDRFLRAFAVAGTPAECRDQLARYAEAGATEIALTLVGASPVEDMARLAPAVGR